jgi:hypothetical protein
VPDILLPSAQPAPQINPDGTVDDPIADMLAGETAVDGTEPNALGTEELGTGELGADETVEEAPAPAPRRYRRKPSRPDDWKKNYSIFGGGF